MNRVVLSRCFFAVLSAVPVLAVCWSSRARSATGGGGSDLALTGAYSVQKLAPQAGGATLQLQLTWGAGRLTPGLPAVLRLYAAGSSVPVPFYDDGTHGDPTAADGRYTAQLREDIPRFVERVRIAELRLATGGLLRTDGAASHVLAGFAPFDLEGFNRGHAIRISALLVAPSQCEPEDGE